MGSCENSLEVEVVPKSIHQTAVEQLQHQNACLIKVLESEQEQLPCLEGFHISNSDNVGPSSMLDGCTEFSKNDKAGSLRLEDASVVDKGIGLACENGNAASLVPGEMLEDECGITGGNLNESQSGTDHCSPEIDGLCMGKVGSSDKDDKLAEHCEESLLEGASVDKGINLVRENGNVINLAPGKLLENECGIVGGNLNERQSGIDDCSEERDGLCVEKLGRSSENYGLVNSLEESEQSLELMPASGSLENHDEQVQQRDDRSGTVGGDIKEKSGSLAASDSDICDGLELHSNYEMSTELRPMSAFPRNEVEYDKHQGSSTSLETVLVVLGNKSVGVDGTEAGDDNQTQSLPDRETMQEVMPTDPLVNYVQQDDRITNSTFTEGVMNEKSNISPGIDATICNQLASHQGFDKSLELMPVIGSPEKSVVQDEQKFDRPVSLYSDGVMENKSDLLAIEKTMVDNQILSPLIDELCMEPDSCSGFPGNSCQQNDLKTKPESAVPLGMALDGTPDALVTLDSDTCNEKSSHRTEMPKELSITGFLVSSSDIQNDQKNGKDANCVTAESVPTNNFKQSDLDGCIDEYPSQACQRTLENLAMADSLDYCDQRNEQRDDKSVNGPFVETILDAVEEGSDVTVEIKVEACNQEFPLEGDACDVKGCSPKIAITSPRSCQSFGASRNSSYRELDAPHLIGKDGFSVIYSSSAVDYSEATNNGGEDLVINDCPSTTGRSEIRLSSSRRSSRTRKSSRKPQTKRAAKKSRNKDKVRDVQIFKAERRKRSCFSKPARSSNWGLLGNIAQFFEQSNGLGLNETHNHEPFQTKVGRGGGKRNNSRAGGSSQRFSVKRHASTSGIRLKVKVGNEVVRDSLNIIVPEVIDTSASAGVVGGDFEAKSYQGTSFGVPNFANFLEVKMGEEGTEEQPECFANKLEAARIHSDASVSDVHVVNKNSESIVISQKLSGDSEAYYVGVPSHVEVETLNAATEKRYTDPGTSPDSEVINLGPEGQVNTRSQEDFADAVLTSSKAFIAPGVVPVSKKGKKKGRVTHASEFFPEDKSPGVASSTKVKAGKNRGVRQRKSGEVFPSENFNSSTGANASSNLSSSKECSDEQLPLSGETELIDSREDLPDELTETKISSVLDVGLRLSEAQTSSNLLSSTKSKGCWLPRKSGGASKGECKVSDKERSRREDGCRQRRKEQKSVKRNKVKEKNDYNENEEADPEIGNCIADDTQKFNPHDTIASVAVANLDMASSDAVDQHLPMDNAWVRCDECLKWRRIPVALVDSIGQTNCHWICKDNMDKAFADCSISQEKSNAEINAELGLSDADEDACDVPLKNRGLEYKRTAASKEHEFTRISTNQFLHRSRKTQTIDEIMVCHCKLPLDGRLGCRDECLNRMLNIECVRGTCPCGDLCSNQQFQKRNYAKMKWDRCGKKGFGLRLEEDISKGQFLIEYVGEVLDMHTYEARQREYAFQGHKHFYFMTLNGSEVIDACAKGNLGRFINHSCDPNCRTEKWVVNGEICIGLFALRDIKKGEELTFDYNYVRVCGAAAKRCYCGSPQCRGYIGGDPTNTEVIDQVDSDEEFLEPVMLEVGEAGYRIRNRISRSSSCDDVELQVTESISNNRDKMDSSTTAAQKMEAATEIKDSMNPSIPAISRLDSSLEVDDLKESFPSSRQQADDATIEFFPAVKQENSIEQIQGLDTSSATVLSKLSSDDMVANRKPKTDEKRVFVKSRFLIKTSCESGLAKKGKFGSIHSNVNKVQMMACKSQVLSLKPKKFTDGTTSGRFEAVEGKLNELLDNDGGISKRKDAAKGYLKFLLLTAASGASGNGEAIQSNRDLSMILDALLKTKSRAVLIDIINKNGLRMLHNMLKQYRSDFKKTPILRKLLKVLEYLAVREILTPEHIYGGPPCPGMESFRKSMLSLTEHNDKQVHQIARSFRDRWFPRHGRKYSYMDRDDGKMECHRGSISNRVSASQDHLRDLTIRPTEVIDGAMQPKVTTASVETAVNEGCSLHCVGDDTKTRKRKSRWDQPAEEKPFRRSHQHDEQRIQSGLLEQSRFNPPTDMGKEVSEHADKRSGENSCCPHCVRNYCRQVEADCADLGRQTIQSDAPPGFSSPLNPPLVLPNASSTIIDGLTFPVDMVVGHPQRKFNSRLSVSYGIPLPIVQQFGLPQHGTVGSWTIAPGMPFHPFPPLPPFPHHKNETPAAAISMAIDGTAEEGQQLRQDPPTCYPNENNLSTNAVNQPDIVFPGENSQTFKRVRASSQDLGRRYFRQQKWNKGPPWMHQVNGWGHLGSNSKGVICSTDVVSVTNEPRNSYCSQDVSCRMEKAGDCINQQNST